MAGAASVSGLGGSITVGSALVKIRQWTLDRTTDTEDTSHIDQGHTFHEHTPLLQGWNGTFDVLNPVNAITGTIVAFSGTDSTDGYDYSGSIIVTAVNAVSAPDRVLVWRGTFLGTGALTGPA